MDNDQNRNMSDYERLISEHRLWSSSTLRAPGADAIADIQAQLDRLSTLIGEIRRRTAVPPEPGPRPPRLHARPHVVDILMNSDGKPHSVPRTASVQLADVVELLSTEDSLNLAAVAMIHAKVREVVGEATGSTSGAGSPESTAGSAAVHPKGTPFAGALALLVSDGTSDEKEAEFTMAVIHRTCDLYAQMLDEATEPPRGKGA